LPTSQGTYHAELTVSDVNSSDSINWTITVTRPKTVTGQVLDSGGSPLEFSSVMVVVRAGADIRAVQYGITNESGVYSVTFNQDDWSPGDTLEVSAANGSETADNSTDADVYAGQVIDLRFAAPIPEIVSSIGLVLAVASAIIAVFGYALSRRRR
jgi:hypothetical protein